MAIALDRGNIYSARTSSFATGRSRVVPAAAVWEPSNSTPRVNNVRTLGNVTRTVQRSNFEHRPLGSENCSREDSASGASVRSNLALGGMFGMAIFFGILFTGFNAGEEPVAPETTISSTSATTEVFAR